MGARILLLIIAFFFGTAMTCGGVVDSAAYEDSCPAECPSGYDEVDFCPAFTDCLELDHCADLVTCAPDLTNDAGFNDHDASVNCDEPLTCPEGTLKVSHCPEDELCTRISRCDESILCLESDLLCQQEPLCPDGDRPLDGCEDDDQCYRNNHCSGPVDCLRCDENLPDGCPDYTVAVDQDRCDDLFPCQRVETCQATLWCAPEDMCQQFEECPVGSHQVDGCDEEEEFPHCFGLTTCQGSLYCEASHPDCDGMPACPPEYSPVNLDDCLEDQLNCHIEVMCGSAIGCVADD
jgi:hypothetical protein